ncbi:MAG: hypothetical protein GYB27_25710 [Rhodobacteraceae bacterium]|nr:hypothetical protein [Paracoccaceae bacterium]
MTANAILNGNLRKRVRHSIWIPLGEILSTELAFHDERDTYLLTVLGKPFASSGSLDNRVRKWTIATGLCIDAKDEEGNPIDVGKGKQKVVNKFAARSNHGIRIELTALMVMLGTMGNEMMASFGWPEPKTASIYTKKFQRRGAATAASKRMTETKCVPRPETCGPHLDQDANKIKLSGDKWQPVGESNPSFQVENLAS